MCKHHQNRYTVGLINKVFELAKKYYKKNCKSPKIEQNKKNSPYV